MRIFVRLRQMLASNAQKSFAYQQKKTSVPRDKKWRGKGVEIIALSFTNNRAMRRAIREQARRDLPTKDSTPLPPFPVSRAASR
jgi:IS5 family transposase